MERTILLVRLLFWSTLVWSSTSGVLGQSESVTDENSEGFRIAAFNVQVFGQTKARKADVMDVLSKIIQRYHVIFIQEIRDSKQTAIYKLLNQTNDLGPASYDLVQSARLGRTSSKEQYAFIYRKHSGIQMTETYQYPDDSDEFEREPFAVKIHVDSTELQDFVMAGAHIDPDVAVQELDSLLKVHSALKAKWNTDNILMMGDFNADCRYVSKSAREDLAIRDQHFHWLIGDDADTTTKSTDCAYDRFVVTGEELLDSIVPGSARVYRFDTVHNLDSHLTVAVSDHYPIELAILQTEAVSDHYPIEVAINQDTSGAQGWKNGPNMIGTLLLVLAFVAHSLRQI